MTLIHRKKKKQKNKIERGEGEWGLELHRNQDKLRPDKPLGSLIDFTFL